MVEGRPQSAVQDHILFSSKTKSTANRQKRHTQRQMTPGCCHGPDSEVAFNNLLGHDHGPGRKQCFPVGGRQCLTVRTQGGCQGRQTVCTEGLSLTGSRFGQGRSVVQRLRREGIVFFPVGEIILLSGKTPRPGSPVAVRRGPARHQAQNKRGDRACQGSSLLRQIPQFRSRSAHCSTVSSGRSCRALRPSTS